MKIWDNKKNWEAIFKYLLNKKIEERSKKIAPSNEPISLNLSNINVLGKAMVKNIWKVGKNMIGMSESKPQDTSANNQINERNLCFALEEINWHMINLGLKNELTIDLIIELGMKYEKKKHF